MISTMAFSGTCPAPAACIGFLPLVLIMASGCGSGNDGTPSTGSSDSTPGGNSAPMADEMRLETRIIDYLNDGVDDQREVFEYDEAGRAVLHTIEDLMAGTSQVIVFDYATDGSLLSKTDGQSIDSYTYEDGRLVAADRAANGMLSYRYDENDRLTGVSGEGFFFDDDCVSFAFDGTFPTPEFEITYVDDLVARIDDTINLDTATVTRNAAGWLERVVYSGDCYDPEPQRDEYTYDALGRLTDMFVEGTGYRDVNIVSNNYENDRLVEVTIKEFERPTNAISTETIVRMYDDQDQLVSQRVMVDGVDIGQVRYTYQQGRCLQPGSADPSNVINVESARLQSGRASALLCGYWFDERDF